VDEFAQRLRLWAALRRACFAPSMTLSYRPLTDQEPEGKVTRLNGRRPAANAYTPPATTGGTALPEVGGPAAPGNGASEKSSIFR
jgi:hypothetical protein